ncbi:MAG: N-acetylmuramoyl-L-alanine amidase, partial [Deltaproteobacteria bacterium]|nr:N-acetylmuramoyl-L-alanine amidase [Deltaproteobacteria bacterium]
MKYNKLVIPGALVSLLSVIFFFAPCAVGTSSAQNQREELGRAIADFEKLSKDTNRGMQREPWEKQAAEFERIKKLPGNFAAEAFFYEARSHEELADRSKKGADYTQAARLYGRLVQDYPRHALADNALFNQSMILSGPLKEPAKAVKILDTLIAQYPKSDMYAEAVRLRDSLRPNVKALPDARPAAGSAATPAVPVDKTPRSADSPQTPNPSKDKDFQYPKGTIGVVNAKAPASGALLSLLSWDANRQLFTLTIGFAGQAKYNSSILPPVSSAANTSGRLVLDLQDTQLEPTVKKHLRFKDLPVSGVRISEQNAKTTRLVLDLNQVSSYKITVLYKPYQLKVEISADKILEGGNSLRPSASSQLTAPGASGGGASGKAPATGTIVEQLGLGIKTVVVDAGHGGTDPGAIGNGITESQYTLEIAQLLGKRLQSKGFTVIYSRNSDKRIDLKERTTLANEKKADIFISIHLNSSRNKDALGLETYYLDVARSDAASVVAARENAVDVNATSDLQFILSDLTRNSKRDESKALSTLVLDRTIARLKASGFGVRHNGVRSAPFYVLMGARMPAFLIEVGYLSNSADAGRLKNKKYLESLADGITEGLVAYRGRI